MYRKINSNIDHQILQTDLIQNREMVRQYGTCSLIYQNVCTFQLQTKVNPAQTSRPLFTIWTHAF